MWILDLFFKKRVFTQSPTPTINFADIENTWARIEELSKINKPSTYRQAVIEADKLVDYVLKAYYPGRETAGARLKEAKERFLKYKKEYENLWYAHKLRNELVHKIGFDLPMAEARQLLDYYKQALNILGVLR